MARDTDLKAAQLMARNAVTWMEQWKIPPDPVNFELAFHFAEGKDATLKREFESLAGAGFSFDSKTMDSRHKNHGCMPPLDDEVLGVLSDTIAAELGLALQAMASVGSNRAVYGNALAKVSGELGKPLASGAGIMTLIDKVLDATHVMEARTKALESQLTNSSEKMAVLQKTLDSIRGETLTDALTGINNRKAFDVEFLKTIRHSKESGTPLSLIMFDIDKFKNFNDRWGHQIGDEVLQRVAACLSRNVKGLDTAARYGGEEFVVILPRTGLAGSVRLADQIRADVESNTPINRTSGETPGIVTVSAGVAQFDSKESAEEFLQRADVQLYAAKHAGRNRVVSAAGAATANARNGRTAA